MKAVFSIPLIFAGLALAGCSHLSSPVAPVAGTNPPPAAVAVQPPASPRPAVSEEEAAAIFAEAVALAAYYAETGQEYSGVAAKKDSTVTSAELRITNRFTRFGDPTDLHVDTDDPYYVQEDSGTKSDSEIYIFEKFTPRAQ